MKLRTGIIIICGVAALNLLLRPVVCRYDLTADKRYTLSRAAQQEIQKADAPIDITVYLQGEMNAGFRSLRRAVYDMLSDMQRYNRQISVYTPSEEELDIAYKRLDQSGYGPVIVHERQQDGRTAQTRLYPYMMISYKGRNIIVSLLQQQRGRSGEENLNASQEGLEYTVTEALHTLTKDKTESIAFLEGHGEQSEQDVYDWSAALSRYFQVDRGVLGTDADILNNYKALIIADPQEQFSDTDKYIIDQYLMQGGSIFWLVNGVRFSKDMLTDNGITPIIPLDLNISDMLFRYGIRINPALVQDLQCLMIPVDVSSDPLKPQYQPIPWTYSPLLLTSQNSPVTRNVMQVSSSFTSCIDIVGGDDGLKKDILLATSTASALTPTPAEVDLTDLSIHQEMFKYSYIPVAVSVEGSFPSVFTHRMPPEGINQTGGKKDKSVYTKQIIAATGNICRNEWEQGQPLPTGYDRYTKTQFGNRDFLVNALLWLTDDSGLIELRQKTVALRLINDQKAHGIRTRIQTASILLPLLLILAIGLPFNLIRKHRYTR